MANKLALVTGASSGIGLSLAQELAGRAKGAMQKKTARPLEESKTV